MLVCQTVEISANKLKNGILTPLRMPAGVQGRWEVGWVNLEGKPFNLCLAWHGATTNFARLRLLVSGLPVGTGMLYSPPPTVLWERAFAQFPASASGRLVSDSANHAVARVQFELELEEFSPELPTKRACQCASRFAELHSTPTPHDVRLSFPSEEREIWASETLLKQSPYFATLLSSGFAESLSGEGGTETPREPRSNLDDSDDELDSALPPPPKPSSHPIPPHKTITIIETAYTTYLAVVCYLQSGEIAFAPLTSSFRTAGEPASAAPSSRTAALLPSPSTSTPPLLPVSSKSVYRLSHLLELPALSALANFRSQLTVQNAAYELFSDTASCYNEVLEAVMEFVLARLEEVLETEGMKEMEVKAKAGELTAEEGAVWAKLAIGMGKALTGK
ncbi:hypothetical protein JCM10213_008264 [Rhodosporidiobolus nylandii]